MVESLPFAEENSASQKVSEFVTRVWQHPLLDQKTIDHRHNALQVLPRFMERFGIDRTEYIGIPYGSFLWITDESSDYDYRIINFEQFSGPGKFSEAQIAARKDPQIHLADFVGITENSQQLFINSPQTIGSLLLTPDEYLVGNTDKACELRLKAVEQLAADPDQLNQYWANESDSGVMESFFKVHFKNWAQSLITPHTGPLRGEEGLRLSKQLREKRQKRLATNLTERLTYAFDPNWSDKFLKALDSLQIPPFEVYAHALKEQNGGVQLSSRFAAQTLEQARSFKQKHTLDE